jgi:hypothetical protein
MSIDHFLNFAWLVEGGVRVPGTPIALRVSGAKGGSIDADNGGDMWRATAGLEVRSCVGCYASMLLGVDAGYQHQTWGQYPETETHRGPLVGGHIGVDAGTYHFRARAAFELYSYRREFVEQDMTEWQPGVGFTAALGYRI